MRKGNPERTFNYSQVKPFFVFCFFFQFALAKVKPKEDETFGILLLYFARAIKNVAKISVHFICAK